MNDRALPHVRPVADAVGAAELMPLDLAAGPDRRGVRHYRATLGAAGFPAAFGGLLPERGSARPGRRLLCRRVCAGDGHLVSFLPAPRAQGRAADAGWRQPADGQLLRRREGGGQLQHHGAGQGRAGSGHPRGRDRSGAAGDPRQRPVARPDRHARGLGDRGFRRASCRMPEHAPQNAAGHHRRGRRDGGVLASDRASGVTGSISYIDGGRHVRM